MATDCYHGLILWHSCVRLEDKSNYKCKTVKGTNDTTVHNLHYQDTLESITETTEQFTRGTTRVA